MAPHPHRAYDIFISHNRADKAWVRRLAAVLADHEYNGRKIRPWLLVGSDILTEIVDGSQVVVDETQIRILAQ